MKLRKDRYVIYIVVGIVIIFASIIRGVIINGTTELFVIDLFIFNGEPASFFRLEYLKDAVDLFVLVEMKETFSGVMKEKYYIDVYADKLRRYEEMGKLLKLQIDKFPFEHEYTADPPEVNRTIPYAPYDFIFSKVRHRGLLNWAREKFARDIALPLILDRFKNESFILFSSDADELPRLRTIQYAAEDYFTDANFTKKRCAMDILNYNYRWHSPMAWWYPLVFTDHALRDGKVISLSSERWANKRDAFDLYYEAGWHLSYFMTNEQIAEKLQSFAHQEFNKPQYTDPEWIQRMRSEGKDLFNRSYPLIPYTHSVPVCNDCWKYVPSHDDYFTLFPPRKDKVYFFDMFIFNGEPASFFRLEYLKDAVDLFILVEMKETFSGVMKENYYVDVYEEKLRRYEEMGKIWKIKIDRFPQAEEEDIFSDSTSKTNSVSKRQRYLRDQAEMELLSRFTKHQFILMYSEAKTLPKKELFHLFHQSYATTLSDQVVYFDLMPLYYSMNWTDEGINSPVNSFLISDTWLRSSNRSKKLSEYFVSTSETFYVLQHAGWNMHCFMSAEMLVSQLSEEGIKELLVEISVNGDPLMLDLFSEPQIIEFYQSIGIDLFSRRQLSFYTGDQDYPMCPTCSEVLSPAELNLFRPPNNPNSDVTL